MGLGHAPCLACLFAREAEQGRAFLPCHPVKAKLHGLAGIGISLPGFPVIQVFALAQVQEAQAAGNALGLLDALPLSGRAGQRLNREGRALEVRHRLAVGIGHAPNEGHSVPGLRPVELGRVGDRDGEADGCWAGRVVGHGGQADDRRANSVVGRSTSNVARQVGRGALDAAATGRAGVRRAATGTGNPG